MEKKRNSNFVAFSTCRWVINWNNKIELNKCEKNRETTRIHSLQSASKPFVFTAAFVLRRATKKNRSSIQKVVRSCIYLDFFCLPRFFLLLDLLIRRSLQYTVVKIPFFYCLFKFICIVSVTLYKSSAFRMELMKLLEKKKKKCTGTSRQTTKNHIFTFFFNNPNIPYSHHIHFGVTCSVGCFCMCKKREMKKKHQIALGNALKR